MRGAEIGSRTLEFEPRRSWRASTVRHRNGGERDARAPDDAAGAAARPARSTIVVEGGTHNPMAPPFEFLERAYLPILRRMGANEGSLERYGFYPAGGGRVRLDMSRARRCGPSRSSSAARPGPIGRASIFASLPFEIARRELATVRARMGWRKRRAASRCRSPIGRSRQRRRARAASPKITELFTACGERGIAAEVVAQRACRRGAEYLAAGVPVGRHLADQLLLPLALAGGGLFVTLSPSPHLETQCEILSRFLRCEVQRVRQSESAWRYEVRVQ